MIKKIRNNFLVIFLAVGLLISSFVNAFLLIKKPMVITPDYAVLGVIDGDTLVIEGKNKVRLRQVQAPELNLCGGDEAKKELEKLVSGKRVRLENEIPDPWGRTMAMVFVGNELVNKSLIEIGVVRYYHDVTQYNDELKNAQNMAEEKHLGIFLKCESADPPNPKCIIKGNIRNEKVDTKIYFLPNCAQYKFAKVSMDLGENWFCTEKEAIAAGFTKAETCN